jgi:hypothetical protein
MKIKLVLTLSLIFLFNLMGCSKSSSPTSSSSTLDKASLNILSGNNQFSPISQTFQNELEVQISGTSTISGVPVYFQVIEGSDFVSLPTDVVTTDASGIAKMAITATANAGIAIVRATVTIGNNTKTVNFTLYINGNATDWRVTRVNGGNEVAGTAFGIQVEALLPTNVPDPDFDGLKYLSFSTSAPDSNNGDSPVLPPDGYYNFVDGVIQTPVNFNLFKSSDTGAETYTITVAGSGLNPGTSTAFLVDDAAVDGIKIVNNNICTAAAEIGDITYVIPTPVTIYVLNYDAYGNCVDATQGTVQADWSKGFADTQMTYDTALTNAGSMTFSPILGGFINTLSVVDSADAGRTDSTGDVTLSSGTAANFFITGLNTAGVYSTTAGQQKYLVVEARDSFGNIATNYTGNKNITFTTTATTTTPQAMLGVAAEAPDLPPNGSYFFSNGLLISPTPNLTFYNSAENPTVTLNDGTISGTSPAFVVNSTPHTYTLITDGVNNTGSGFDAAAATRTADDSYTLFCGRYDSYGNYLGDDATADWTLGGVITAPEITPGLTNQAQITYAPSNTGAGTITCTSNAIPDGSGSFNVVPGAPSYFKLDGGAGNDNDFTVTAGNTFPVTVNVYDADDNFCSNYNGTINTTVAYLGVTTVDPAYPAEISPTHTSAAIDGTNITSKPVALNFTSGDVDIPNNKLINDASGVDRVRIQVIDDLATVTAATTGFINVNADVLAHVVVRDGANNTGSPVAATSTDNDNPINLYAAGYDDSGNFIGDQTVTWSTTAGTSACDASDLTPTSGTTTSFDPHDAGTCTLNIDAGGGITDSTGTITVSNGAVTHFNVELTSGGTNVVAGDTFSVRITALDADNERVLDYAPDTSYTLTHTNPASPEGTAPDTWTLLPADFALGEANIAGLKVYNAASDFTVTATETGAGSITGTSGTITVDPNTLHHYDTQNSGGSFVADGTTTFSIDIEARDEWGNPTSTGVTANAINSLTAVYDSGTEATVDTIGGFTPFTFTAGNTKESVAGLSYRVSHGVKIVATDAGAITTPASNRETIVFNPDINGLVSYDIDTFSTLTPEAGVAFTAKIVAKDVQGNVISGIDADLQAFAYTVNSNATNSEHGNAPNHPTIGAGTLNFTDGVSDNISFTLYNDEIILGTNITVNNGSGETGNAGSNNLTVGYSSLHQYTNDQSAPPSIDADGSTTFIAEINARDEWGNIRPGSSSVTISMSPTDGHTVGNLGGSTLLNLSSGTTTVSDLTYDAPGTGKLDATDGSITMDMTRSTNYTFGAVATSVDNYLVELVDGGTVTAGDTTYTIRVTARDSANNTINNASVDSTLSGRNFTITGFNQSPEGTDFSPLGSFLWTSQAAAFSGGVATIDVTPVKAEAIGTITVTDNLGVTGENTDGITVNPNILDHIVIDGASAGVADNATTYAVSVQGRDQFGNLTLSTATGTDDNLELAVERISGVSNTGPLGGSITGLDLTSQSKIDFNVTYQVAHSTRFRFTTAPSVSIDNTLTPIVTWAMDPLTVDSYTFNRTESTKEAGIATAYRLTAYDVANNQIVGEDTTLNAMTFTPSVADASCDAPNGTADVIDSFVGAGTAQTGTAFGGFNNGVMDISVTFYNITGCVTQNFITIEDSNTTTVQNSDATLGPMPITSGPPAYYHTAQTGFPADTYAAETSQTGTSILISQYDTYGNLTTGGGTGTFLDFEKTAEYGATLGTLKACPVGSDGCAGGARLAIDAITVDFASNSQQTIYDLSYDVAHTIAITVDNGGGVTTESQPAQTSKDNLQWDMTTGTVASYTFVNPAGPEMAGVAADWTLTAFDAAGNQIEGADNDLVLETMTYTVTEQTAGEFDAPDSGPEVFSYSAIPPSGFSDGVATISMTLYSDSDVENGDFEITDDGVPVTALNSGGTTTMNPNSADRFLVTTTNLASPTANALEKATSEITVTCVDVYGNPSNTAIATSLERVNVSDGQTYGTNLGTFQLATTDGGGASDITGLSLDFSSDKVITLYDASYDVGHDVYIRAYNGSQDTVQADSDLIEWVAVNDTIDHYDLTPDSGTGVAGSPTTWTITAYDAANNIMSNENGLNKGLLDVLTYTITDSSGGNINGPETGTAILPVGTNLTWATDGTANFNGGDSLTFYHAVNDVQNDDITVTDSLGNNGTNSASTMNITPKLIGDHFHVTHSGFPVDADGARKDSTEITINMHDEYGNITYDPAVTNATVSLNQTAGYTATGTFEVATSDNGGLSDITSLSLDFSSSGTIPLYDAAYDVAHTLELLVSHGSVANDTAASDSDDILWNPSTAMVASYDLTFDDTTETAGVSTNLTLTARDAAGNILNEAGHQATLDTITFNFTSTAANDAPNGTATVGATDPADGTKTFASGSTTLAYIFYKDDTVNGTEITVTDTNNSIDKYPDDTLTVNPNVPDYYETSQTGFSADAYAAETPQTATSILISQYDTYGNLTTGGGSGTFLDFEKTAEYGASLGTLKACPVGSDGCAGGARLAINAITVDFASNSQQTIYDLSYDVAHTIAITVDNGSGVTTETHPVAPAKDNCAWDMTNGTVASYTFENPAGPITAGVSANWTLTTYDAAGNVIEGNDNDTVLETMTYTVTEQTAGEFDAPDSGPEVFSYSAIPPSGFTDGVATITMTIYSDSDVDNNDFEITDNGTPVTAMNSGGTTTVNANSSDRFTIENTNLTAVDADNAEKATSNIVVTCVDDYGNPTTHGNPVNLAPVVKTDAGNYGTNLGTLKLATTDGGGAADVTGFTLDFSTLKTHTLHDASYDVGHKIYLRAYEGLVDTAEADADVMDWTSVNATIDHYILTYGGVATAAGTGTTWTVTAYDVANNVMSNENGLNDGLLNALTYTVTDNSGGSMNGPEAGTVSFPSGVSLTFTNGVTTLTGGNALTFYHAVNDVAVDDIRITDSLTNTGTNSADTMDVLPKPVGDHFHVTTTNFPQDADGADKTTTRIDVSMEDEYGNLTTAAAVTAATISIAQTAGYASTGTMTGTLSDGTGTSNITGLTLDFSSANTVPIYDIGYDVAHTMEVLVSHASVANDTDSADSDDITWNPSTSMVASYDLSFNDASAAAGATTNMTLTAKDAAGNTIDNAGHQATLNTINFTFTATTNNDAPNSTATVTANDPADGTKTFTGGSTTLPYVFYADRTVATTDITVTDTTNTIAKNSDDTIDINPTVPAYFSTQAIGFSADAYATETPQTGTSVVISQYDTYGNLTTGGSTGTLLGFAKKANGEYGSTLGTLQACSPVAGDACGAGGNADIASISVNFTVNSQQTIYDLAYDVANTIIITVTDGGVTTSSQAEASMDDLKWDMVTGTVATYEFTNPTGPLTAGGSNNWTVVAKDAAGNQFDGIQSESVLNGMTYTVTETSAGEFDAPNAGDTFSYSGQTLLWGTDGTVDVPLTLYSDSDVDNGDLEFSDSATAITALNTGGTVTLNPATKAELAFVTQPSAAATAGVAFTTQPVVRILDTYGNHVTTATDTIDIAAFTNAGCTIASGDTLQGTISVAAIGGDTTYAGVNHEKMETIYLEASSGGLTTDCSNAIVVDHNTASSISYTTQPSAAATAGVNFTTQPAIEILDAYGNLVDDGTHTITLTAWETADCSTTASTGNFNQSAEATAGGTATFAGTNHELMETIYIRADDGAGLTDACSNNVVVDHNTATTLSIATQPSATGTAGVTLATQPVIEVHDAYGNVVDDGSHTVTLTAWETADCSTTVSGGTFNHTPVVSSSGISTFTDVDHEKMETIYIRADDGAGLTDVCTNAVTLDHAAAASVAFSTQPSATGTAGVNLATQPAVNILDAFGNLVNDGSHTITLSAWETADCTTTASSGTFNQSAEATAGGTATFSGTNHELMETIYIRADDGAGLADACSNAVAIDHNTATTLSIATQPSASGTAGVTLVTQPVIEVHDAYGNVVDDGSHTVTLTAWETPDCTTTASTGTFNHTPVASSSGTSTFTDVDHEKMETIYIRADDGAGLTDVCTNSVAIDHAAAAKLGFTTEPSAAGTAGVDLATQPEVTVYDAFDNVVDDGSHTITLTAWNTADCSTTASTGTINNNSVGSASGVATFTNLNHEKMETIYLHADDGAGLTDICSTTAITIDHAGAASVAFSTQPSTTATAGVNFTTQPAVEILDNFGNLVNDGTHTITLTAWETADCTTTVSSGTFNQSAEVTASGTATFAGTNHELMETIYIRADDGAGLTDACSNNVVVDHNTATTLAVATQPGTNEVAGATFGTQPVFEVHDDYGNIVDNGSYTIDLTAYTNAGCTAASGGAFNATSTASSSGTATFTDVDHDLMETIYIKADHASLTEVCTNAVVVDHAAASKVVFSTQPSAAATAGVNFGTQPVVEIQDAYNNVVDDGTHTITLSAHTNSGCSSPSGTALNQSAEATASGTATFSGTNHEKMETIYIKADDGAGLTDACSNNVVVDHNTANKLVYQTQPSGTATAGTDFASQPVVQVHDAFDNLVDDGSYTVNLTAYTTPDCSTTASGGTTNNASIASASGSSTFTNLNHEKAETIYLLADEVGALTTACSTAVAVSPAAANSIAFTTQPVANETVNKDFATQPVITSYDTYGNVRDNDSATGITLTAWSTADCTTTPAAGSISGASKTLSSGVATFTNLQHDTAVATYYVKASDGTRTACANVTQVYPALTITPATPTVNTLGTQTFQITGGVPPIVCDDLTTDNSQATITSSCYTAACGGDYCIDYQAGYYGNGVTDVVAVHDTANVSNNDSSSITVNGPDFTETTGNGNYGSQSTDTTQTMTIRNDGNLDATSLTVTIGGADAAQFAIGTTDDCTGNGLVQAGTCDIDIDFLATAAGAATYNATVTVRGSNGGEVVITLTGTKP